ncbi:Gfo/Idh/MocA family protein [Phaeobacter sp. B1627]|uniref:Gfo/Idh/MocA family protein n=1 Tax=Phaeobacter sp. B1627 TaxID=2583809 RepID=UPI001118D7D1|nr:Gfo/Idh/MocA family oxidoreductase [Phaeobacter sp. B1627]TNJ39613.1 Gfo/Idh/MocA family oxidoreductase [Phaeobacter sp. B1627]
MDTTKRPVIALIGAGMVAKTHVAACVDAAQKVRLKGISSRSNARADALAKDASSQLGHDVITYGSVDAIASDPEIDFVIIATPPNVRLELIEPLAQAGKHILLEKPIGRTAGESRDIVDACKSAGVKLGIVFQHRARSASQIAAEMIKSGELGPLGLVEMNVPWWREQAYYDEPGRGTYERDGGGVLISQAIHTIDLALSLTGPVMSVQAMAKTTRFHHMESEDFVVAGLEFTNGAVGSLVASTASYPGGAESITLHFQNATLHLESGQLKVNPRDGEKSVHGDEASTGGGADPMAFTHDWHQTIIENFARVVTGAAAPFASGEDAMAAHNLIEAITRSSKNGKIEYLNS